MWRNPSSVRNRRSRNSSADLLLVETLGLASKAAADVTDHAKSKFDEVSGKAKKTAEKAKKKVKEAADL